MSGMPVLHPEPDRLWSDYLAIRGQGTAVIATSSSLSWLLADLDHKAWTLWEGFQYLRGEENLLYDELEDGGWSRRRLSHQVYVIWNQYLLFRLLVLLLSQQSSLQDQQYITGIHLTIRRPTSQVSCLSVFNQNEIY